MTEADMKHAVILAHPKANSLSAAAAEAYAVAIRDMGHKAVVRDLYRMGFDPCLKASEIPGPDGCAFESDVRAEREVLADVDVFAFVYPFWFNAPPAVLKGYVDRVFGMGFGFGSGSGGTEPLLTGRKLISFSFSGAPEQWVRDTGALSSLVAVFDSHVCRVCGLQLVDHVHTGGVVPGLRDDAAADILRAVKAAAFSHFGAAAPAMS
jgi:NAD(P)H dehydrogenase (quinone)